MALFRKDLSIPGLLAAVHKKFSKIFEPYYEIRTEDGYFHQFRFINGASLNKSEAGKKRMLY
jgi:hypothetical protein